MNRLLWWSVAGWMFLAAASVRHVAVWGSGYEPFGVPMPQLLHAFEAIGLCLFIALAGRAYLEATSRRTAIDERAVWSGAFVLGAIAFAMPPFLSSDVFDYLARGRVEAHYGANPYVVAPLAHAGDPVIDAAQWPAFIMPYGPLSAALQGVIAALAGESVWLGVVLFKLVFLACHLLTGRWLHAAALRVAPAAAPRVLVGWLWNPWLLLESAGSAHNEALMAAFLAAMVLRIADGRFAGATFAFGCALLTKHGCALLGPLLLALAVRRHAVWPFVGGALATGALLAPAAWHWFAEPGALEFLAKQTHNRGASLQHFLVVAIGEAAARPALLGGYAITLAALAFAILRTRDVASFARQGQTLLLVFLATAMPLVSPWYHLWWLPLVALSPSPLLVTLRALAICGPLSYLVWLGLRRLDGPHQAWQWTFAVLMPIAFAAHAGRRARRARAGSGAEHQ